MAAVDQLLALIRAGGPSPVFGNKVNSGAMMAASGNATGASTGNPNALLAAIQAPPRRVPNAVEQARRAKNPRAQYRRAARAEYARQHGLADNDWRTWGAADVKGAQGLGILPGEGAKWEKEFGLAERRSDAARALANQRWHGDPDGPAQAEAEHDDEVQDILERVNALRAAQQMRTR